MFTETPRSKPPDQLDPRTEGRRAAFVLLCGGRWGGRSTMIGPRRPLVSMLHLDRCDVYLYGLPGPGAARPGGRPALGPPGPGAARVRVPRSSNSDWRAVR